MAKIGIWISEYLPWLKMPAIDIHFIDLIEIIILSFLVYSVLVWIKKTRAWTILKGLLLIGFFVALTYLFQMDTLTFLISRGLNLIIMAAIIIFQPELRRVVEQLGETELFSSLLPAMGVKGMEQRFSDHTVNEIVRACVEMARVKTGALIVMERNETLVPYERSGIVLDAVVSSQLLINIFEKNTPLHDGAVIVRGDKVTAATCYLPLSVDPTINKDLGTRHRAAVGISEVTDSLTIVVSEETGSITIAQKGELTHNLTEEALRARLVAVQDKVVHSRKRISGRKRFLNGKKGSNQNEA